MFLCIMHTCWYAISTLLDDCFLCVHFTSSKWKLLSFQCHTYTIHLIRAVLSNYRYWGKQEVIIYLKKRKLRMAEFWVILTVKVGSSKNIVVIIETPFIEAILVCFWIFLPVFSSPKEEMAHHFYSWICLITYFSVNITEFYRYVYI